MWSMMGAARPAPPPPRRRLSKYKLRRLATAAVAALLLISAAIIFCSASPKRDKLVAAPTQAGAEGTPVTARAAAVPYAPAAVAVPELATGVRAAGVPPEAAAAAAEAEAVASAEALRKQREEYFAAFEPRRHGPAGDAEVGESVPVRDFEGRFGIPVTNTCVVPVKARRRLKGHDITQDALYKSLKRSGQLAGLLARYAGAIEPGVESAGDGGDNLYSVRLAAGQDRGFGIYAERAIANGTVLGEYGGKYVLASEVDDPEYAVSVPALSLLDDNGEMRKEAWVVDASEMGNALRFCNDLGPGTWNVEAKFVPLNGLWHVIYETIAPVAKGDELSVAYGTAYWERRQQIQAKAATEEAAKGAGPQVEKAPAAPSVAEV